MLTTKIATRDPLPFVKNIQARGAAIIDGRPFNGPKLRAVTPASLDASTWGSDLVGDEAPRIIGGFTGSLYTTSVYFGLLARGALATVPPRSAVAVVSTGAAAGVVDEGRAVPMQALAIDPALLEPQKCTAIVAGTKTLFQRAPEAQDLLTREIQTAVSRAVDKLFMDKITDSLVAGSSTSCLDDLAALLDAVDLRRGTPYFICSPDIAKLALTQRSASGQALLPDARVDGGEWLGVQVLPCDALDDGSVTLCNAGQIVTAFLGLDVNVSEEATVEMLAAADIVQNSLTSTGAQQVSFFQSSLIGVRIGAALSAARVRDAAVASLTGVTWPRSL